MAQGNQLNHHILNATVVVSALGYFVDIFDLLLFSIVRVSSLKDLGFTGEALMHEGVFLINMQMTGLLIGGLVWGILGDKMGRISVLFGSILTYSLANILNAFVGSIELYGWLRLLAGIGLAGELGAAITLVGETMTKERRGYGTAIVASVGILGAVFANLIGMYVSWRVAYVIGGVMGLGLLVLRFKVLESGIFEEAKAIGARRGDFLMLFRSRQRMSRYLSCILVGLPIWFVIGILITFSPELSRALKVKGEVRSGDAVMYSYLGLALGDLLSGVLSQVLKTRKKVVFGFLLVTLLGLVMYVNAHDISLTEFYGLCFLLGLGVGYWAIFVTTAAETFGTNLRATVASTVPNFVRGSVVPLTLSFRALVPDFGLMSSAMIIGCVTIALAMIALWFSEETFGRDLQFFEVETRN